MKRRLSKLAFLVGCLVALGLTSPATRAACASSTSGTWYCERRMNDESCVWYCCGASECWESPCGNP